VQYELMKLIAGRAANFTAVGDDDQSIYGWRGATLDNLKRLPADYPALKVIRSSRTTARRRASCAPPTR
jgi:ATP-dependent DNA helicase Rep